IMNPNTNNQQPIIPSIEDLLRVQKKLAMLAKQQEKTIQDLTEKLNEKDKEIQNLKEKNKSLENKNQEMIHNVALSNLSSLKEIKTQEVSDKVLIREITKTLDKEISKKDTLINNLNNELEHTRNELELERQINLRYFDFKENTNSSSEKNNAELQLIKISTENTSLKNQIINYEETLSKIKTENISLKELNEKISKNFNENLTKEKEKFDKLKTSYNNMIKEFLKLSENYKKSKEEISQVYYEKINLQEEIDNYQRNYIQIEKQSTDVLAENEGMKKRIETYSFENASLKKEISSHEDTLNSIKMSTKIFYVYYYYLGVSMNGNFTFDSQDNIYSFIIENRSAKRKFSFLDAELTPDNSDKTKFVVKFLKDGSTEEYYSNEAEKLLETFNTFKKKAIMFTDISSEAKNKKDSETKAKKAERQLSSFFGAI
ncbi:MAG: hypothetical protein MJ252_20310, partial [archaeon]|nr:hypothetical protein [archaeon]